MILPPFKNVKACENQSLGWLQSLKQFFINVSYHILVASRTLMALELSYHILVASLTLVALEPSELDWLLVYDMTH